MINLKNKNIIVTGASGGIGNSIVKKLSEFEANILATGTKIEKKVRWRESIINMINHGVTHFIEIGPGKVLSGLIKRIDKNIKINTINNESDIKDLKL